MIDLRGIARDVCCAVLVRPDPYVAHVLPLDAQDELTDFLAGVLIEAVQSCEAGRPGSAKPVGEM